jgi:hypothetical protein
MKFITSIILIALLSFAACLFLPWWSIAIAGFITAIIVPQKPKESFWAGFIALFLLWGCLALYISNNNDNILAHKMSLVLIKIDSPFIIILITALIGALVAAFAALTGSYIRKPAS